MNRKFFIMALVRGIFGYFPCGLGVAIIAMAFSINSLRSFLLELQSSLSGHWCFTSQDAMNHQIGYYK
ncbi:hypothetical protein G7L40_26825 [Paenibacillus polymyxa]|uniref:hypothetical protein n=1 Tax=Paenibacillus polymyxa TaxID=1406 RepID=UPI0019391408|nr:hypothetical protein [Paenibacillus polymyxa]QPK61067.1 hypothetical protein G7L40_26825 [Paenibacillus polymyxa]